MDRLSSCYFCGAALDASLDEYPVVPAELDPDPDDQASVVLCRPCSQKLDGILEAVVGAADSADASGRSANAGGSADVGGDVGRTLAGDPDLLKPVGSAERNGGTGEGPLDEADPLDEPAEPGDTDTRADASADPPSAGAGGDQSTSDASDEPTRQTRQAETGGDSRGTGGADSRSGDAGGRSDDRSDAGDDRRGSSSDRGGDADGTDADGDDDQSSEVSMTRLENTKVMRLLENREFPVDEAEFVTVATNAYQISRDECEKILSLADQHGLISVENGQIRAGDR